MRSIITSENFGPYQFNYARIIEFPGYASFAQAFAGTMPYSEAIGFNADTAIPSKIDFSTYVIAHEMAHQWWAHQVIGADMQGGHADQRNAGAIFGADGDEAASTAPDQIRRFLKYELDGYLRGRRRRNGRGTAARASREPAIHPLPQGLAGRCTCSRSGSARTAVNRALRALVDANSLQGRAVSALGRPDRRVPQGGEDAGAAAVDHRSVREDHALRPEGHAMRRRARTATAGRRR